MNATIFFLSILLSIVWSMWARFAYEPSPFKAGMCRAVIVFITFYSAKLIVDDARLLIPATSGAFIGAYLWLSGEVKKKVKP
jgi:hypothetical protein